MINSVNNTINIMIHDKIFIKNIPTQAVIGIHNFERVSPQKLIVSVELQTDIRPAAASENIDQALNYDQISQEIDQFAQKSNYQLIEALAENLAKHLLDKQNILAITLTIKKPSAIMYTQDVGVEIYREKQA